MTQPLPNFQPELQLQLSDQYVIIGIDEVGRGCFAGPITVGAVCLSTNLNNQIDEWLLYGINDSKKLNSSKRAKLARIIQEHAAYSAVCSVEVEFINQYGIVRAFEWGVVQAADQIAAQLPTHLTQHLLIDGFTIAHSPYAQTALVHGDQLSISIAAASIIAKHTRDEYMMQLSLNRTYNMYHWDTNKGYGTVAHRQAIRQYGISDLHRKLYVKNTVNSI